jgi:hypothetical protein
MIPIYFVWERLNDYAKKHQSGQDTVADFNSKIAEVQLEVHTDLSPFYRENVKIRNLFQPWIRKFTGTEASGQISFPIVEGEVVDRILSGAYMNAGALQFGAHEISEGEIAMINDVPQRRPGVAKKNIYYYTDSANVINTLKASTDPNLSMLFYYLIFPTDASISFTEAEYADEYVQAFDEANSVNLGWNMDAANIIIYKMLEKYGITTREPWLTEYSKLGVTEQMMGRAAK